MLKFDRHFIFIWILIFHNCSDTMIENAIHEIKRNSSVRDLQCAFVVQ